MSSSKSHPSMSAPPPPHWQVGLLIIAILAIIITPLTVSAVQNIFISSNQIMDIQVGTEPIRQVYVGNALVWERCSNLSAQSTQSFSYTGGAQSFTAPQSGCYQIELWGAMGGSYNNTICKGGAGGYTSGITYLNKNETIYIYLGGMGTGNGTHVYRAGGYNGGGNATSNADGHTRQSSGAGASDIRQISGNWNDTSSLASRIMVAGGGGGGAGNSEVMCTYGGAGGGLIGGSSQTYIENSMTGYGTGGSQTTGGTSITTNISYGVNGIFGAGGSAIITGSGSGYYGGGASICSSGGGSSYISGHTGAVAITSATDQSPKSGCTTGTTANSCSTHYSGKIFTSTKMIDGAGYAWTNAKGAQEPMPNPSGGNYASGIGHTGNGAAKITFLNR